MDGIGGTVKNVIFRKVKSGLVTINSPEEFAKAAMKFVPKISTVYLPETDVMDEVKRTVAAPSIKGTLKIHMIRRRVDKGVPCMDFYELASDAIPFHTQWYGSGSLRSRG